MKRLIRDLFHGAGHTDCRDSLLIFIKQGSADAPQPDCFFFIVDRETVCPDSLQFLTQFGRGHNRVFVIADESLADEPLSLIFRQIRQKRLAGSRAVDGQALSDPGGELVRLRRRESVDHHQLILRQHNQVYGQSRSLHQRAQERSGPLPDV